MSQLDFDVWWKVDFIRQLTMTSSVVGLKRSSNFPKPNLCQKNRSLLLFGGLLQVWSATVLWIPVKPLHLRSMLSKSMRCTKNCNVCRQRWSTERAQFFSRTMPDRMSHSQCFKNLENWATEFCLIHHIHLTSCQPTTTFFSISTTFQRERASTGSGMQKTLSKSSLNPEAWVFMLQE